MRKLFTLALAVLASASMWAGVTVFTEASQETTDGSYTIYGSNSSGSAQSSVIFPDPAAEEGFPVGTQAKATYFNKISGTGDLGAKLAENKRVAIKGLLKGDIITVYWFATNTTNTTLTMSYATDAAKGAKLYDGATQNPVVAKTVYSTELPALTDDDIDKITNGYNESAGLAYISSNNAIYVYAVKIAAGCEAPTEALSLALDTTKSEGSGLYAGDKITFTISGGNGAETSMTLDGAAFAGTEWTATEGEHTFVLSQDVKDGVCGDEIEVKLNVASKTPVSAVTVSGPSGTYLGKETTLTCEAENATDYQWYKGGTKIDGATSAEYSFTPDAVGDLVFYCEAWNKFNNGTPVKSADFTVTVTEGVCGVLAELKVTGEKTGTLSGEFTGTPSVSVDKNGVDYEGQTGYKLKAQDSHVGFTLTDGTLKAKDKVIVYVTKVSDGKKLQIFSDKGNTLIAETEDLVLGANTFVLGDDAEGATGVFVYRVLGGTEGAQYNAYIASVTLKRPCGEESSDATLKSLTVGEDDITLEEGKFDYEYEVPADYTDTELAIAFELNDAKATADKKSPLQKLVPDAGNSIEVAINVTAEDGTKATYTITITKPEKAKSDDASIKELKIENEVITAVNDTFSYEVPAEANLSDASVEFVLNHENATASKTSPFLVKVPASGEAATEEELVVTAEDEITIKTYIISVSRAAEEQGLWDVQGDKVQSTKVLRDGQMYILRGEKTYTIVGAEMK